MSAGEIVALLGAAAILALVFVIVVEANSWRTVHNTGAWEYQEHVKTGKRRIVQGRTGGHQPRDHDWIERGGDLNQWSRGSPPTGGGNGRQRPF